jgi:hypothetical protein
MKTSFSRVLVISILVIGIISVGLTLYAGARHPNLTAAQNFIEKAITKITAAQVANEYDMNGHAAKAKSLLDQALVEIKLAAEAADAHR